MNVHVLKFDSAGQGHCLYTELLNLAAIGSLQITRASNIEFNNHSQQWEVKDLNGKVLFTSLSRTACLDWENLNLQPQ
jgi:hypothetical protein